MGAARSRGQGRSHASERPCLAAAPLRAVRKGLSAAGQGCAASVAESAACLDAGEHGARLVMPRRSVGVAIRPEGSLPCAAGSFRGNLVFGRSRWIDTTMQAFASAAKLRAAGPFYKSGTRAVGGYGTPPPRIDIGNGCSVSRPAPNSLFYLYPSSAVCRCRRFRPPDAAACQPAACRG